ncbi:hypothetical protein NEOKW01_0119 [Nematocida sp. AWRm80]|nr:hypothetical protein NEOKW01_0119 [Nematocida sp. AWRm80]
MESTLRNKLNSIDNLIALINNKDTNLLELLRKEINTLKRMNKEYQERLQNKKIKSKEQLQNKIKYTLNDGSIYINNTAKKYKYLYDSKTNIITYEFSNGQIERTFPIGIKEIRTPDGKIVIKTEENEYEILKEN